MYENRLRGKTLCLLPVPWPMGYQLFTISPVPDSTREQGISHTKGVSGCGTPRPQPKCSALHLVHQNTIPVDERRKNRGSSTETPFLWTGHRSLATAKLGCYPKHCGELCEMTLLVLGIAGPKVGHQNQLFFSTLPLCRQSVGKNAYTKRADH